MEDPTAFTAPDTLLRLGLLVAVRMRPMMLGSDCWKPFGPRMTLEAVTLLPLWPAVKDPGFCPVIGGKSEMAKG